jgi:hypothetical protein
MLAWRPMLVALLISLGPLMILGPLMFLNPLALLIFLWSVILLMPLGSALFLRRPVSCVLVMFLPPWVFRVPVVPVAS